MKATALDAVDLIYSYLENQTSINGEVCKYRRKINSDREDIVINSLPLTNDRHQRGVCNVNIYVPNLDTENGSQPNTKRLNGLAKEVCNLLDDQYGTYYNLYIENHQVVEHQEEFYYNIRIKLNIFK